MKKKIAEIFGKLLGCMTVSGYAERNAEKISRIVLGCAGGFFADAEVSVSENGSVALTRPPLGGDSSAGTLLIDAHIDTVGMAVSEILPGGFLAFTNVGGIDARILPSLPVRICGRDGKFKGVVCSVPPHLMKGKEPKSPQISELYIDTGISSDVLEKICPIGTPVEYDYSPAEFAGADRFTSPYLDDKLCAAAAIAAFSELSPNDVRCGITLNLSANEETNGEGALFAARRTPSAALVLDVNFASGSGVPEYVSAPIGGGVSISYSAATDRRLTKKLDGILAENRIPFKRIAEPCDTGTNASRLAPAFLATPCAVMSVPISYMHTPCECASLHDAEAMARAVSAFARSFYAGDEFADRRYIKKIPEVTAHE